MAIRDPKDNISRIIDPNLSPDAVAVRGLANQQAMENNPIFKVLKADNERMRTDMRMLANQLRSLTTRFHAILDYFTNCGVMLEQELDAEGFAVGAPYSPKGCSTQIWEGLVDSGYVTMPAHGIEAYLAEHIRLGDFIVQVNQAQIARAVSMEEIIEQAREFNGDLRRLVQVKGDSFGLTEYLNANPDGMTEEELDALGAEFGLEKKDDKEEEPITDE
jgi:hypothetical protein